MIRKFSVRSVAADLAGIAVIVGLLLALTFLPSDTSLSQVRTAGYLRACVPPSYPPLVTGNADRPGIDIELLRAVAARIGVQLILSTNAAMGRDFNPRNWGLTRAQCQVIAGGVVDSAQTRSFLDTGPPYAETGWAIVAPAPLDDLQGLTIGTLALVSGLDRIGLSSYLRRQDVTARVVRTSQELVAGIAGGTIAAGISEALLAAGLAEENGWWVAFLPDELTRYNLVIGLWKGDLTLKREIDRAFHEIEADGTMAAILDRYGATPMDDDGVPPEL